MEKRLVVLAFVFLGGVPASAIRLQKYALSVSRAEHQSSNTYTETSDSPFLSLKVYPDDTNFESKFQAQIRNHLHQLGINETVSLASRQSEKPLLWSHVHKMAGSFVCTVAAANGERVVNPSQNCNWDNHDSFWNMGEKTEEALKRPSCEERAAHFKKSGYSFGMIERELTDKDICSQFRYGTLLVEPLQFIHTLLHFEGPSWFPPSGADTFFNSDYTKFNDTAFALYLRNFINRKTKSDYEDVGLPGWKFLDNFAIRTLLGTQAYYVPPHKIDESHLEMAKDRLSRFDIVKTIGAEHCVWNGKASQIGWDVPINQRINQGCSGTNSKCIDGSLIKFSDESKDLLLQLNQYDMKLWQHFAGRGC